MTEMQEFYNRLAYANDWKEYAALWREFYDCPKHHRKIATKLYWDREKTKNKQEALREYRVFYNLACLECKEIAQAKMEEKE